MDDNAITSMRRIDNIDDDMKGVVTYEFIDARRGIRRIKFDKRSVVEFGVAALMRGAGLKVPNDRLPVMQCGKQIGTVPATFEPMAIKSTSFWYTPRAGDFTRSGDAWIAALALCPGDLEAVPGFVWDRGGA